MTYHKEGPACGKIPCDPTSSEADCECPLYSVKNKKDDREAQLLRLLCHLAQNCIAKVPDCQLKFSEKLSLTNHGISGIVLAKTNKGV